MLFIIYGTNSSTIKNETITDATCPNCNTEGSLVASVIGRYAHIFWIPFFPIGKTGGVVCQHCQQVTESKNLPKGLKTQFNELKKSVRSPLWHLSGVGIVILGFTIFTISKRIERSNEAEFIKQPLEGDVYRYETETGNYSTMKVFDVKKDSVFIQLNEYEVDRKSGVSDIDILENYPDELYGTTTSNLLDLYNSEEIYDVDRK